MTNSADQGLSVVRSLHPNDLGLASGGEGSKGVEKRTVVVGRLSQVGDRQVDRPWIDLRECDGFLAVASVNHDATLVLELAVKELA